MVWSTISIKWSFRLLCSKGISSSSMEEEPTLEGQKTPLVLTGYIQCNKGTDTDARGSVSITPKANANEYRVRVLEASKKSHRAVGMPEKPVR